MVVTNIPCIPSTLCHGHQCYCLQTHCLMPYPLLVCSADLPCSVTNTGVSCKPLTLCHSHCQYPLQTLYLVPDLSPVLVPNPCLYCHATILPFIRLEEKMPIVACTCCSTYQCNKNSQYCKSSMFQCATSSERSWW